MENKWFEHRSTAHSTQMVKEMLTDYGYQGYGWYNVLLEKLSIEPERRLEVRSIKYLADEFRCNENVLNDFIKQFFDVDDDDKYFRSEKLDSLLERYDKTIEQRSLAGLASGKKRKKKVDIEETPPAIDQYPSNDRSTTVEHNTSHHITSNYNKTDNRTKQNKIVEEIIKQEKQNQNKTSENAINVCVN